MRINASRARGRLTANPPKYLVNYAVLLCRPVAGASDQPSVELSIWARCRGHLIPMFNLLRYFSLTSAAVILVLALAMQAAYRQTAVDDLIAMAERHNVALAQSFSNTIWSRFSSYVTSVSRADGETLRAHPETRNIHKALKTLTTGLPVLKVKIYNLDGLTVYSSEPSQMGVDKSENPRFLSAAHKGTPASSLTYRDTFSAFSSIVYDREIVETYIPVRGAGGRIEGVFELYSDVTPLMAQIRTKSFLFVVGILLAFGLLYAILFLVVRRADRILKKQSVELHSNEERITAKNVALEHEVAERVRVAEVLKESEERFQSFAEIGSDWMWEMDADLRFSYFSDPIHRMTGLPREHYLGKTRAEAGRGVANEAEWQQHLADLEAHRPFHDFCYTIVHAEGSTHHWSISGTPIFGASGKFEGYRGVGSDISERKATEEAMLTVMKEAEIANRAKSQFLANMSHELRTPLNAIIGFSEIIKDEILGPVGSTKYREYADDINMSGQHLLALINNILDLSKVESGAGELCEENIDIPEAVRSIRRLLMGVTQTDNVELELDVLDDIPMLHADEHKVKQILLNLLSNAIKFTPGGGKVTLKIWSCAESGYEFQVIDTGIGIAFEDIPKAMAPFQQIDGGLNRKHDGTGLGLPLAKSLVEMHGGYLDLQSKVGVGTTVTVHFPAERIVGLPHDTKAVSAGDRKAG